LESTASLISLFASWDEVFDSAANSWGWTVARPHYWVQSFLRVRLGVRRGRW
jgi:hypothetical protein